MVKRLKEVPLVIEIEVWDLEEDDLNPSETYTFYNDQLEEAKKIVECNECVFIFINGMYIKKEAFFEDF